LGTLTHLGNLRDRVMLKNCISNYDMFFYDSLIKK